MNQRQKVGVGAGVVLIIVVLASFFAINSSHPKETDYEKYVTGLRNWTVEADTKEADFLKGVTWDKKYIKDVTVNDKNVNLTKEGTYALTYTIDVLKKDVKDVKVKKKVKVISKEEAKEEAKKGEEVVTEEGIKNEKSEDDLKKAEESKKKEASSRNTSDENKTSNKKAPAQNKNTETSKSSSTNINTSKPKCRTETITIPEQGHNERYLISDAVYEDRPVYRTEVRTYSRDTGEDITGRVTQYISSLMSKAQAEGTLDNYTFASYEKAIQVQVSTERVKVKDAVYGERWVVDKAARTETKQVCE